MQKLVIKGQFMGVKPCEIELRRFLLLIGEQASGKSTIAKLIYFFQTLPDEMYQKTKGQKVGGGITINDVIDWTRQKFEKDFKLSAISHTDFDVTFDYGREISIHLRMGNEKKLLLKFSDGLETNLKGSVRQMRIEGRNASGWEDIMEGDSSFLQKIYDAFDISHSDFTYLVAGRNMATAFPDMAEVSAKRIEDKIEEERIKGQDFEAQRRSLNERLFNKFVLWGESVRGFFRTNGGSFEATQASLGNQGALSQIAKTARAILKGEYASNAQGEFIKVDSQAQVSVSLTDASSGQQEVLRILQGLFLAVGLRNRREFFVVEEPEAHLYPLAQKEIINAFSVFLNAIPQGRLIITTHSPYILACVNILLFASFVAGRVNGQSDQIAVPRDYWLKAEDFTAYSLGQHEAYCVDIKNPRTGLIAQNYLDKISEELGTQYHQLYDLLTLSPA